MRALSVAPVLVAAFVIAAPAAGERQTARHEASVRFVVGSLPVRRASLGDVPRDVYVQAAISFNGHPPQSSWADSPSEAEYGWHGVVVAVSVTRRSGPVMVSAASLRHDHVRVFVRVRW